MHRWKIECDRAALINELAILWPAIRATRFHKRPAWLTLSEGQFRIEIDRGAIKVAATGTWPKTVAIRCGDLYRLSKGVVATECVIIVEFVDPNLVVHSVGLSWKCLAKLEEPPPSYTSTFNGTRLWATKE